MKKFEYTTKSFEASKSISAIAASMEKELNILGENGWELVTSITQPGLGSSEYSLIGITQKIIFVLKRQSPQSEVSPT